MIDEYVKKELVDTYIAVNMTNEYIRQYGLQGSDKRTISSTEEYMEIYYDYYNKALEVINAEKKTDVVLNSSEIDDMFNEDGKIDLENEIFDK